MIKIIRVGQRVTFGNAVYKAEKCTNPIQACSECDLYEQCQHIEFNFKCAKSVYFKCVKHLPRTRRCKKFPKSE